MIENYSELFLKKMREKHLKKRKESNPNKPIATWVQDDIFLDKSIGKSLTIILRTVGCRWAYESGGCTMCSYLMDSSPTPISAENLKKQFDYAIEKVKDLDEFSVKIFTSGSFLDEFEVPREAKEYIFERLGKLEEEGKLKEIAIESRPEFITEENLKNIREYIKDINVEIGVGVETFNEEIRNIAIHKGVTTEDIINAINIAKKYNVGIKAYLLIKPLFITEKDAILDAINSANKAFEVGCSRVSFCPATVHKGTLMEYFWSKNQYRPPFLWSIIEILKEVKSKNPDKIVMCDTSGIPTKRGAHNLYGCECNYKIKNAIEKFTLTQDIDVLDVECKCRKYWEGFIEMEEKNIVPLGDKY
ncbi:archaeosine biosynthesis radical SAM protein RaSEA [Methanotorris igneus]|uniref:Radical SAM core domain-containing protein n=1 Tax=Methanotorris igneus (strain DSM 5666 / JCM 11834 / Kol 5) TaxID=880724 RepID=F6BBT3_METIK|nr:archaeosine biosynthesis radical SAM protein RaSEA [Methanotorris igneus]AEF97213.1 Conserved hypothetical protein CHP01210 [Methanotorris igneus Kol 5]